MGSTRPFEHREALGVKNFGHDSLTTLLEGNFIPKSLLPAYESVAREKVKLPKRSMKHAYDDQATLRGRKFVPEKY